MTLGTAQELRGKWKKAGNPECAHVVLILQHTFKGFVTGEYACAVCGTEICHAVTGNCRTREEAD
jgi:uncharacterized protein (DUF983 family)